MEECAIYMKKLISVLLCVLMLLAMAVPAFAAQDVYPIVYIEGQGCSLFRPDGTKIYGLEVEVLDIVKNFEEATGVKIPYSIKPRRDGDIAENYADASLAKKELGWEAKFGIKEMCEDSWRWQKNNPEGY